MVLGKVGWYGDRVTPIAIPEPEVVVGAVIGYRDTEDGEGGVQVGCVSSVDGDKVRVRVLVLNKAAPSAARYRPGEGTGRWERPHCTRHSPAHPQGQCFCPLACALLQFNPGRLANLGWDSWF